MTLRWGVIGAGGIAVHRTIPGLLVAGHEVVAICRRDAVTARSVAERFGAAATTDHRELLSDPSIDAVYIATPPASHEAFATESAAAGKHVLLEKPVSMDAAGAHRIAAAFGDAGRLIMPAMMMRQHPLHQRMRALVQAGEIGEPRLARLDFCFEYDDRSNWRADAALGGGGAFADLGPHLLDLLTWVTGDAPEVFGALTTARPAETVDAGCTALLSFGRSGHASVTTRFDLPAEFAPGRFELWGSRGSLVATGTIGQEAVGSLSVSGGAAEPAMGIDLYAAQAVHFADLLSRPGEWTEIADEAVRLQSTIDRVYAATRMP